MKKKKFPIHHPPLVVLVLVHFSWEEIYWYTLVPGGFGTNYIIFRNAEIFKEKKGSAKEKNESFVMFWNILAFRMKSSKLIN
jgi:hypothetical protein